MQGPSSEMDTRIALALQFMRENHNAPLTVRQLAEHVGLSASRFQHLFVEETGTSFKRQLLEFRFERARRLLADWTLSIKEVCYSAGFSWPTNFAREFRCRFGETPSEYRRKTRSLDILGERRELS